MSDAPVIFGLPAISAEIGVSVPTLKAMIDAGEFPIVEIGGRHAIRRGMLNDWWAKVEAQARVQAVTRQQERRKAGAKA